MRLQDLGAGSVTEYIVRLLLAEAIQTHACDLHSIQVNYGLDIGMGESRYTDLLNFAARIRQGEVVERHPSWVPFPLRDAIIKHCQALRLSHDDTDEIVQRILGG